MMKTYASVVDGRVYELVVTEHEVKDLFSEEFVAGLVDVTGIEPKPQQGWVYEGGKFQPYEDLPEVIAMNNKAKKDGLLRSASVSMAPALVSLQLGDATEEEKRSAKAWRDYYRAVESTDVNSKNPDWPELPTIESAPS